MNDQLKKFVDDNREDFDHLEPSTDIFLKIKDELKKETLPAQKVVIKLMPNYKWLVAASVLIVMFVGYLVLNNNKQIIDPKNNQIAVKKTNPTLKLNPIEDTKNDLATHHKAVVSNKKFRKNGLKDSRQVNMSAIYNNLVDSTSSSTRLAAILKIQNSGMINNDIIDRLAKTINDDANSNVRLAALNVMGQYVQDSYVSNTFIKSLNTQKDPLVQLGLIELLSQTNNSKLDDKLYALANDPTTFAAVKDQAYLILLNQNKL